MIYLDGSAFFFDIEGCFSNLINSVRDEKCDIPENIIDDLIKSFSEFYKTDKDRVSVFSGYAAMEKHVIENFNTVMLCDYDDFSEKVGLLYGSDKCFWYHKTNDMKIRINDFIEKVNSNDVCAVVLSNPCFPTSLALDNKEIVSILQSVKATLIVDESHLLNEEESLIHLTNDYDNLIVVKKLQFGGNIVCASGCKWESEILDLHDAAAADIIFKHNSAIKTAVRKKSDSINSLYIRIKKLAVKYDSIKRLYRSKSDSIFMECDNSNSVAEHLFESGIKAGYDEKHIWFTSGSNDVNELLLEKLEKIL